MAVLRVALYLALSACWVGDRAPVTPEKSAGAEALSCSTVDDLAQPVLDPGEGRLRTHTNGALDDSTTRTWVGKIVPSHVPAELGTLELFILDSADGGHLAFYREPYDRQTCKLGNSANCAYEARHYDRSGALKWSLPLNDILAARARLEIQDIRLANGILYFNEACQSYSSAANGQCSSLVAYDPVARRLVWRSEPLTSNGRFVIRGCYIVAGYGFTSERDHVFLLSRGTGKRLQTLPSTSAPEAITLSAPDRVEISLYAGPTGSFKLENATGPGGKLISLDGDRNFSSYGGASYGGASYGTRP